LIFRTSVIIPRRNRKQTKASLDEVDPELIRTFEKLGIPFTEQKMLANVAVDAVFDSVSVATTYKKKLLEAGVIFCSFTEAVAEYPELIQKYLGSVVPSSDNYYAALNAAVFSDGSFVFIRKACAARWNFPRISASTRRIRDSSSAR
jgi:Fe-S cluster assembly protein SufB